MPTRCEDYTVGWICAILLEYVAACELLDEKYPKDNAPRVNMQQDRNIYTFGRIDEHNIVIACLPDGRYGTVSAAIVAERMRSSFPAIRFGLMVGIAGGAPSQRHDIRLGDVIVSSPTPRHGGVLQYDFGKDIQEEEFVETGHLAPPPDILLSAVANIRMQHKCGGHRILSSIDELLQKRPRLRKDYGRPDTKLDRLYKSTYIHSKQDTCDCQTTRQNSAERICPIEISRKSRGTDDDDLIIHYGLIASANSLMKNSTTRDALIRKHDVLCFEMEAAGLMNSFPCLIIRGICDYSDSHKNDVWQGYAAATAAAYAKELLEIIPGNEIKAMQTIDEPSEQYNRKFDIQFSLTNVPVTKKFAARSAELQSIERVLLPPATGDSRRRLLVLSGLGGVGKTQLAVEFMRHNRASFSAIFWLDGNSVNSVRQSMARCAARIPPNQISDAGRAFIHSGEGDIDVVIREMLEWLAQPLNNRWLVIFDNVDREFTPSDSDPLSYDIKTYLPESDHGSILITTRLTQLGRLGESMEVEKVDINAARQILEIWYKEEYDEIECKRLLEHLDGLPLAIAQAGAYLQENQTSITEYLRLYEDQQREMAELLDDPEVPLDDYSKRSVWTTWIISFNTILKRDEHVANLLIFWSFLDCRGLWYGIFDKVAAGCPIKHELWKHLGNIAFKEASFISAMNLLRRHSLIEGSDHVNGYSMHAVIHRWVYIYFGLESRSSIGMLALLAVGSAAPIDEHQNYSQLQQRLLLHAQVCYKRVLGLLKSNRVWSVHEEGCYLKTVYEQEVLAAMHGLGLLYDNQHRLAEAEYIYMRTLEGWEEVLGEKHTSTLITVCHLGIVYREQGRLAEAEHMYMRGLRGFEEALGEKHPHSLNTMHNLCDLYQRQGKLAEAEQMLLRTLRGKEEVLGEKHTSTLKTVDSLGIIYQEQGRLAEAEQMMLRALRGHEEALGEKHVLTLYTIDNLGTVYRKQGRLAEAEQMMLRVLQGKEETLGKKDKSILYIIGDLGNIYERQGRLAEAEHMFMRALRGFEEALGVKHSGALISINNLGTVYRKQGRLAEAEQMLLLALQGYEETLGLESMKTHIHVLNVMLGLGGLYLESRPEEARDMYTRAFYGYKIQQGESSEICVELRKLLDQLELSIRNKYIMRVSSVLS